MDYDLLHEDENSYKLKHPKGHEITVAKQALSDAFHQKLKGMMKPIKMNDGGEVPASLAPNEALGEQDPQLSYLMGGQGPEGPQPDFMTRVGHHVGDSFRKSVDAGAQAIGTVISPVTDAVSGFTSGLGGQPAQAPETNMIASNSGITPDSLNGPRVQIGGEASPGGLSYKDNSQLPLSAKSTVFPDIQKIENQYISGIQQQTAAQSGIAKEKEGAYNKFNQDMQKHADSMTAIYKNDEAMLDKYAAEVASGKVNPNRMWQQAGTGAKISASIGLILGGMGAGLTGGPNQALEVIQKAVDRDIDAQKTNLGKSKSLYSMYMQKYQNHRLADAATRSAMGAAISGQVAQLEARYGTPMAQAQGQMLQAQIKEKTLPNKIEMAKLQTVMNAGRDANIDPASLVKFAVPESHQKKAFDEIQTAQNTRHMSKNITDAFEEAAKENTILRTGAGKLRTPGSVYALHQHMQPTFQDLEGTVRQAAMDNTFVNVTPMPGDSEHKIRQKRQALREYLKSKMSAPTAKGFNIDLSKFESTKPLEFDEIQSMGGAKYKKVQGGWKRVP